MYSNKGILNELKGIGPALIPLQKVNVFTVPAGYFEQFPDVLLGEINEPEYMLLPLEALNTMDVPAGYFDSLAGNILAKIKGSQLQTTAEELKELSPALSATGNDNVFTVPAGYFRDLPEIILGRVSTPAKVISMRTRSSFIKYAVAAVITGLLGLSLFSVFNKKDTLNPTSSAFTASVNDDAKNIILAGSFDKVLETVSDDEIVGYLKNNGQDVKAALVASAIDSKELPAEDEYITNDNTLNNFLDKLNINDYSN